MMGHDKPTDVGIVRQRPGLLCKTMPRWHGYVPAVTRKKESWFGSTIITTPHHTKATKIVYYTYCFCRHCLVPKQTDRITTERTKTARQQELKKQNKPDAADKTTCTAVYYYRQ